MDQSWLATGAGLIVLLIATMGVAAHYLRERRRSALLRSLDPSRLRFPQS